MENTTQFQADQADVLSNTFWPNQMIVKRITVKKFFTVENTTQFTDDHTEDLYKHILTQPETNTTQFPADQTDVFSKQILTQPEINTTQFPADLTDILSKTFWPRQKNTSQCLADLILTGSSYPWTILNHSDAVHYFFSYPILFLCYV